MTQAFHQALYLVMIKFALISRGLFDSILNEVLNILEDEVPYRTPKIPVE